ncbi:carbohydrate ABC transporter membrane protein 2 (CUT1 family) [Orenia metallireducens]|jgi:multiple sugar transport system permease protein|uniref:Carbohydrate ABC transporter membrane protein 2, CUT1 family n=1 Tax=Orenia metallireducens TaxID=1413210 RepID=A0A285IDH0_9FIRM|nr:carbohydrate ABC transporter permease [Orenia metallireducens]PRX19654.1 carbohydrate ABC transporter membrane protein 2 (CUT1 family) [Orenia metallireducens]SNY46015.1 carbohydrate ABC transporter membrane protein 2, CUT1 family [Orenia metallireducens]
MNHIYQKKLNQFIKYLLIFIAILWTVFPIYWMLNSSFKTRVEQFSIPPTFFPKNFTFENYTALFTELNFQSMLANSLVISLVSTAVAITIGALAAYSLSRFDFNAKPFVLGWILITRIFPPVTFVIPFYTIMNQIGLLNTRTALILSYIVFNLPFSIWMLINFFNEIPVEIEESALVDGANQFEIFYKIALPLTAPGIAATAIFNVVMSWNEFLYSLIFVQTPDLLTLPVGLAGLVTEYKILWGPMSAGGVISVIPIIIFVLFMEKHLIKGLTLGSVKG